MSAGTPPQQRAVLSARALLCDFAVPAGARRLSAAPAADGGVLGQAVEIPATADLVDLVRWWLVPGRPKQVLGWERTHVEKTLAPAGSASTHAPQGTTPTWADMFSLPAIPAVLDSRKLIVQVVADGDETAIRVDAQVAWQPARPASEKVPSAASAVTISLVPDVNLHVKPPAPVTVTNPAEVSKLMALIDGLPLSPPGMFNCPMDAGAALVLTFRARAGGPALATATVELEGCGWVDFAIGGKQQPSLGSPESGTSTAASVLKIVGLPWKLTSYAF